MRSQKTKRPNERRKIMLKYYVADAFADEAFQGNPAGVCILDEWIEHDKMQNIAMENNLSETGFAVKIKDEPCTYELRWFTPTQEIDLCGHCTMGVSYILFRFYEPGVEEIHFEGLYAGYHIVVTKEDDRIAMDFPVLPPEKYEYADYMADGMGAKPVEVYRTERDLVMLFDSEETVRNLTPDFSKLRDFPVCLSVYATAESDDPRYDIVARAFWPKIGINEDPVCGSMHSALMPFWGERLGKDSIVSDNLSRRGGRVYCKMKEDAVQISGRGALYLQGEILVDED